MNSGNRMIDEHVLTPMVTGGPTTPASLSYLPQSPERAIQLPTTPESTPRVPRGPPGPEEHAEPTPPSFNFLTPRLSPPWPESVRPLLPVPALVVSPTNPKAIDRTRKS